MMTYANLWYLAKFFLEWEMLQTKVVERIKTHIACSYPPRKSCRLWHNVEKYGRAGQPTDNNIIRPRRFACCIAVATDTQSQYLILTAFPRQQLITQKRLNVRFRILRLHAAEVVKLATLVNWPPVTVGHTLRNQQTPMGLYVAIAS